MKKRGKKIPITSRNKEFNDGGELQADKFPVATEIYNQIGRKAFVMLGAKKFAADQKSLTFQIRGSNKFNYITITLTSMDLYDIKFKKIRGIDIVDKKEINGVYSDQLIPIIERETELNTKLFKDGGQIIITHNDKAQETLSNLIEFEKEKGRKPNKLLIIEFALDHDRTEFDEFLESFGEDQARTLVITLAEELGIDLGLNTPNLSYGLGEKPFYFYEHRLYNGIESLFRKVDKITTLKISNDNPLSTQLQRITGDSYSIQDFEDIGGGDLSTMRPFRHKKTGREFIVEPSASSKFIKEVKDMRSSIKECLMKDGTILKGEDLAKASGSTESKFIKDIRHLHEEIKEVTLNDGTVIQGKDLMKEGGELEKEVLEFTIPDWALSALINNDYSGLRAEDEAKINKFVAETEEEYGNANFDTSGEELGFCRTNDIDNLGSNCEKLLLIPTKKFAGGGAMYGAGDAYIKSYTPVPKYEGAVDEIGDPINKSQMERWVSENMDNVKMSNNKTYTDAMKEKFLRGIYYDQNELGAFSFSSLAFKDGGVAQDRYEAMLREREAAFNKENGARVGDYLKLPNGGYTRFTHDWGDSIQTGGTPHGTYYLGANGWISYSGGLDSGVKKSDIRKTSETKKGLIWFFKDNMQAGGNDISFEIDFRVFKLKPNADTSGLDLGDNKHERGGEIKGDYKFDKDGNLVAIRNIFDKRKWQTGHHSFTVRGKVFNKNEAKGGWFTSSGEQLKKSDMFKDGGVMIGIDFNKFTTKELDQYLSNLGGDIEWSITKGDSIIRNDYSDKLSKKSLEKSIFSAGEFGKDLEINRGGENIYLNVLVYDQNNHPYTIYFYSKENHNGLKSIANSLIDKYEKGGVAGESKFKKGDKVRYIPNLSGLDKSKPLIVEFVTWKPASEWQKEGWSYLFENSDLASSEKDIEKFEDGESKFKKGDKVRYIPKLSGLDKRKPLIVEYVTWKPAGDFNAEGYQYLFENSDLASSEKNIEKFDDGGTLGYDNILIYEKWDKPTGGVSGTIRTTPTNYWVATIKDDGSILFDSWEKMIEGMDKNKVKELWESGMIKEKAKRFAEGGELVFVNKDSTYHETYTVEKNASGKWTIFSESPTWSKRDDFVSDTPSTSGFASKEDAIMVAKSLAGITDDGFREHEAHFMAQGGLIAPNGKKSNLTRQQYKLVRTSAFKEWFGDWENAPQKASKVVDKNGEPLVVWHGGSFTKSTGVFKGAAWFTEDKSTAKYYAKTNFGTLTGAFFSIKNPMYAGQVSKTKSIETNQAVADAQKGKKHDGVIDVDGKNGTILDVIVWNSNQIKLADGTNTTFDRKNPDIRFAEGGTTETPKQKAERYKKIRQDELLKAIENKNYYGHGYRTSVGGNARMEEVNELNELKNLGLIYEITRPFEKSGWHIKDKDEAVGATKIGGKTITKTKRMEHGGATKCEDYQTGGKLCPLGMRLQTLILSKDHFKNSVEAKRWIRANGFKDGIDIKPNTYRFRQEPTSHFSYERTVPFKNTKGVMAVYGCPKTEIKEAGGRFGERKHLIGKTIQITSPNKNYDSYRKKEFVIENAEVGGNKYNHELYPQAMVNLKDKQTGKEVPFSLYEWEFQIIH